MVARSALWLTRPPADHPGHDPCGAPRPAPLPPRPRRRAAPTSCGPRARRRPASAGSRLGRRSPSGSRSTTRPQAGWSDACAGRAGPHRRLPRPRHRARPPDRRLRGPRRCVLDGRRGGAARRRRRCSATPTCTSGCTSSAATAGTTRPGAAPLHRRPARRCLRAAWRAELSRAEAVAQRARPARQRLAHRVVGRPFGQGAEAAFLVRGDRRLRGRRLRRVEYEVWRERSGAPVGLLRVF